MSQKYLSKIHYLNYICYKPDDLIIPLSDVESFNKNKNLRYLYDKLFIAKSQGLQQEMTKYVVVRPRINLCGMGLDARIVHRDKIQKNDFWVELLIGNHISVDIFINTNYGIQFTVAFEGKKNKNFGSFEYWIYLPNYRLKPHIKKWIQTYVKDYNGIINIEIIGDYIIECHLRMGDLDTLQDYKIMQSVIDTYLNKKINIKNVLRKLFLIPLFQKEYKKISSPKPHKNLLYYLIDNENMSHPVGNRRLGMLFVDNLEEGIILRDQWLD